MEATILIEDRLLAIETLLKNVTSRIVDIEGLSCVTKDGLPIASALSTDADEDRISAMTAAMLSLAERVVQELNRGEMDQQIIKGSRGYVIIMDAGEHAVLAGIARKGAKLGLILLDMRRCSAKLAELI